jgi:putative ABC transport system permease protein
MFKARTSRTLLTILGMGVGIGAILFLVSLGYGLQKTLLEKITTSDSLLTLDVTEAKSDAVSLNKEKVEEIKQIEGVVEVSESFSLPAQSQLGDLSADLVVIGTQPTFLRLGGLKIDKGSSLSDNKREGIVITASVVKLFGEDNESVIGKKMKFSFFQEKKNQSADVESKEMEKVSSDTEYEVIGVIQGDEGAVYINSDTLTNLNVPNYNQIKVKCATNEKMDSVRDKIMEQGFIVSSLSDTVEQANQIFRIIQIILMCFGIIALVVSAIGMFNTMTIALLERTNELGIMKSIGASNFSVYMMFVMESAIMGFFGGFGGVLLGFIEGKVFNFLVNLIASRLGGQPVNLFYSPAWFVFLIIAFAAFVGLATGFVPARRASKIDPLDALRYK